MCVTLGNRMQWEGSRGDGPGWWQPLQPFEQLTKKDGSQILHCLHQLPAAFTTSSMSTELYGTVLYPAALLGSAAFSHRCCHHLLKAKGRDLPWPLSHQDRDQELLSSSIRNTMWSGPFPYQDSCRTGFSPAGSGLFPSAGASPSAPFIEHKESISTA